MMKYFLTLLAAMVLFSACNFGTTGKGNIITEKRELASFNSIITNAVAEITLVQDSTTSVEVKGYENLVPLLLTSVSDGVLTIETKKHITLIGKTHLEVIIHLPSVKQLNLSGVGSINSQGNFNFHDLKVEISGVGSISLSGEANKITLENSGTGSINCKSLLTDTVYATTSGVGSIRCNAIKYLSAEVSGVGSISYSGDPVVDKSVSGVGSVSKE